MYLTFESHPIQELIYSETQMQLAKVNFAWIHFICGSHPLALSVCLNANLIPLNMKRKPLLPTFFIIHIQHSTYKLYSLLHISWYWFIIVSSRGRCQPIKSSSQMQITFFSLSSQNFASISQLRVLVKNMDNMETATFSKLH